MSLDDNDKGLLIDNIMEVHNIPIYLHVYIYITLLHSILILRFNNFYTIKFI